uniref:Immunoglobulin V-set domain-containing protein n=1 Tax=Callorhinchus milii TaxID=7868 RepID=A0A4W3H2G1_CALMI
MESCSSVVKAIAFQARDLRSIPGRAKCWASFLTPHATVYLAVISGPALPVPAIAGSDVVLDCKCSIDLPREGVEVRWFRTRFESPVHLYKDGLHQLRKQDEAYRHRTQLFVEEFINGDVSLRLRDVRVSDNGDLLLALFISASHCFNDEQ